MPEFPFPTDVHADLRALFEHDRVDAQVNHLGYSSLSPGEGSAEVRDASGAVIAQFGHAAGKAGFLMPRGSGWQTIQEWVAEEIASGTQALGTRVTTLEGRADAHATRLGSAEGRLGTLEGRADSHASRIGAAEGRLNDHATRIGAAENVNTAQTNRINNVIDYEAATRALLKSNVDALWERINSGSGTKPIFPSDPPPTKG
ncbi:hypothetical protein OVA14_07250 [Agrococcus sp. SL85]|uniref:hypothetical protein n=1 Tax=Agrococcus sp. SL85 TaxID=2995141 RepID=UPI00226CBE05|nr:hypothetical protein [Agrococcus sp. SL85]WAC65189.1 hypothetical protein OVA14_07250 [Agrococcus sp. SL85]